MPSTPYIRILTSVNADAAILGTRTVANGDTIAFTYESVVAWPSDSVARLEFFSYPDGWAGPGAPWVTESVSVVYNGTTITYDAYVYTGNTPPPSFTAPASPAWGKYLLSAKLGNGQKGGVASSDMYDESSGFEILSSQGLHDAPAWRESSSFAEDRPWTNWTEDMRKNLATIDAGLAAAAPVVTLTAGAGMTGGGTTASNRTFDVVANADGSIVVNANDIQVGVISDAQHGTRGGGTTHAVVIAAGAAGFMIGADKTKLDGIEAAADVTDFANVSAALAAASGSVSVNSQKITSLATPAASTDAATMGYVDSVNPLPLLQSDGPVTTSDATPTVLITLTPADGVYSVFVALNVIDVNSGVSSYIESRVMITSNTAVVTLHASSSVSTLAAGHAGISIGWSIVANALTGTVTGLAATDLRWYSDARQIKKVAL